MSKNKFQAVLDGLWDIAKRSLGLALVAFFPGAGVGSAFAGNWVMGGLIAFGSVFSIVMSVLGVELASTSKVTPDGIDHAFKQAVTKAQDKK